MSRRVGRRKIQPAEELERAALGCVLLAATDSMAEADELLQQLRPAHFDHEVCTVIFRTMVSMRMETHAVDTVTLVSRLKHDKQTLCATEATNFTQDVPSVWQFPEYLKQLKLASLRRWTERKGAALQELADKKNLTADDAREALGDMFDATEQNGAVKMLDLISPAEARDFIADPKDFLLGNGLISRGQFVTFGGEPGCGKSRLATTLAVAGARGNGSWMHYPVRGQFRTLILQTENKGTRLKDEFESVPNEVDDFIKISRSLPNGMAFGNAAFRRELLREHDRWPFDLLVVDPWNDVCAEDGQSDFKDALLNIQRTFQGRSMPAVVIVAHLRKSRSDSSGRRKSGRELLHELSGSLALGSTSRTVFVVQPASPSMDDDRLVFEVAKANDADPAWLREHGTRSAWHRRNGAFEPVGVFDWHDWDNPGTPNQERRSVTIDMIREAMGKRHGMKQGELVKLIAEKFEIGTSTIWRAIGKNGYLNDKLTTIAGVVAIN